MYLTYYALLISVVLMFCPKIIGVVLLDVSEIYLPIIAKAY